MNSLTESSFLNRMPYNAGYPANPLVAKQAPDHKALFKSTGVVVESKELATEPVAQNYFEPRINGARIRIQKPKVNFTTPSDPKAYPLGVVPTNLEGRVAGEEPAIIATKVAHPADLLAVFARISAEEAALAKLPMAGLDAGQSVANEYLGALKQKNLNEMMDKLMSEGHTEEEVKEAMKLNRLRSVQKKLNGEK